MRKIKYVSERVFFSAEVVLWMKSNKEPSVLNVPDEHEKGPEMHQLVILGNGFDLSCGLKSSFSHFYGSRTDYMYSSNSIPEDQRNVWDLILAQVGKDDPLWCDIESLISIYVFKDGGSDSRLDEMYHPLVHAINLSGPSDLFVPRGKVYQYVARFLGKEYVSQDELTNYLLDSLKDYEGLFADYLGQQVEGNGEYIQKAFELFAAIRDVCLSDSERSQALSSVLSFNYTTPFGFDNWRLGIEATRNVHGVLGETDIIFGIDGKDVPADDPALPFTKTYRLLSLKTSGNGRVIKTGNEGTTFIKVFGHSLASADYSYFQSIFDAVNLYEGDTKLVFLYKIYPNMPGGKVNEKAIREDLYVRVSHLLIEYGATLDNIDHGKNLMHKLLLEQRLIIEPVEKPSISSSNIYLH